MNAGIAGLDKTLVPITPTVVRICKYGLPENAHTIPAGLVEAGVGTLKVPAASAFTAETNRLPIVDRSIGCPATPPPFYILTFADDTHRVDVWEANGCGFKTNGLLTVGTTTHWRREVQSYTVVNAVNRPTSPG